MKVGTVLGGTMDFKRLVLLLGIASLFAACGGDGSSGGAVKTGVFVDSAVEGLSYSTTTQSGLTNSAGEFHYLDGEVVTFKIGNVEIGAAFGAEYLTPLDITNSFLPSDSAASNVARLLQTLDTDGDPENGITLPSNVAALPPGLDVDDTAAVEAAIGQGLVNAVDAQNHLDASIAAMPPRAVDGVYERVTLGSTGLAGCPDVIDAEVTVSRDAAGARMYEGAISLASGGQYLFTADDSTIRKPTVAQDPDHQYRVDLNTHEGTILILGAQGGGAEHRCSEIHLTTDPAVNLPPLVRASQYVTTIPGCTSPSSTYSQTMSFYAWDKDGFIVNDIKVEFAVEGGPMTTLVNQGDNTSCSRLPRTIGWDPASQSKGGWYCTFDNPVLDNIPCGLGYSFEVSATDNEGLTSTISGGSAAPLNVEPPSGDMYQCWENYPAEACDIVMASPPEGATVTQHAAGSCVSLVPEPRTVISSTELLGPSDPFANVIVNYDDIGLGGVACLLVLDIPGL